MSFSSWADVSVKVQTSDEFLGLGQNQNGHSKLVMRCDEYLRKSQSLAEGLRE